MLKEAYVNFEVAKLLKEKGFELNTNNDYWKIGEDGTMYFMSSIGAYTSNPNDEYAFYRPENSYPCPTHQMALAWLREEKRIFIRIIEDCTGEVFRYEIYNHTPDNNGNYYISNIYVDSYEEAVEAALKYTLENFI